MNISFDGNKKVSTSINEFHIQTDLPLKEQGDRSAPTPYELFLASMGCCIGISLKYFCDVQNISTEGMELSVNTEWSEEAKRIQKIMVDLRIPKDLPAKYEKAFITVVNSCKVKKQLHPNIKTIVNIVRE